MKQEYDKEIDSLLRRGARLAAAGPRRAASAGAPFASSHLDADELSAFAENALPAAARLAAASHLADCDECRGTVVRLSSAADAAGEIEKREAATTPLVPVEVPWWKTLLGVAFAPHVLRYAAPVLVLGLVGVVSFIALRTRQGSVPATVYQTEEARDAGAAPGGGVGTGTAGTTATTDAGANANTATASDAPPSGVPGGVLGPVSPAKPEEQSPVNQPVTTSAADRDATLADAAAAGTAAKKAGPVAAGEATRASAAELSANTVAAPAPAPPALKSTAGTEVVEQPKGARGAEAARRETEENYDYAARAQQEQSRAAQSRNRQGEVQTPDGGSPRNESRAMNNRGGNLGGASLPSASRAERPAASRRGRAEENKARDSAAEDDETVRVDATRGVGGRRFRREGGAWVDVNYRPSMSMTAVRRGTEGYRALVADIPELGKIAEQLGGEVIAVVKGRAYRIR